MTFPNLNICAVDEVGKFASQALTHIISIRNPNARSERPDWFKGSFLELFFGDVVSERDAAACKTVAPALHHIKEAIEFTSIAFQTLNSRTLIFCDYGASRSPAMAYVTLAAHAGPGHESKSLENILRIRPEAVPNLYIVRLADSYLTRRGALLAPPHEYVTNLFKGLT